MPGRFVPSQAASRVEPGRDLMHALDAKAAEIEKALKPLFDTGVVKKVWAKAFSGYDGKSPATVVTVSVAGARPEQHYVEIRRLVDRTGIPGVILKFERFAE